MASAMHTFLIEEKIMGYFDGPKRKVRTIEMLEISDVLEIVFRDLERYNVPDKICAEIFLKYIKPLKIETDKIKEEYSKKSVSIYTRENN